MYTTALFMIVERGKQAKCISTDKWINKMCGVFINGTPLGQTKTKTKTQNENLLDGP